jgi:hypothetical protein
MNSKNSLILAGLILCSVVSSANAETKKPSFEMSADQIKRVSDTTTQISGNAVIRLGHSEIRTDKAKVVINKVTVYTDTFVATGSK